MLPGETNRLYLGATGQSRSVGALLLGLTCPWVRLGDWAAVLLKCLRGAL